MAHHPRAPHSAVSSRDVKNTQNPSSVVSNGAQVQSFSDLARRPIQADNAGPIVTDFATIQVVGGGGVINVDGTNFGDPSKRGGRGATGAGTAYNDDDTPSTVFYGPTEHRDDGAGNSDWISFSGQAAFIYGSGASLSEGMAIAGTDGKGSLVGASLDVFGGATAYNLTAGNGGFLDAGGAAVRGHDYTHGNSLIQNAHVLSGGFGLAGGNKGLVIVKNGTSGVASGTGTLANVLVDAGGMVDANQNGLISGGKILGYGLVESGGTLKDILFNGGTDNGYGGLNGYVDVGGTFSGNTLANGALVSVAGGTAMGNTVQAGGTLEVGANYAHHVAQGADGGQVVITGSTPDEFGSGTSKDTIVSNGGKIVVDSGGLDSDAQVKAGGIISVNDTGSDFGAIISHGGTILVNGDGYASGAEIAGAMTNIGGTTSDTVIENGGKAIIGESGIDSGATVSKGAHIQVDKDGESDNATVMQGGTMIVKAGGYASGATIGAGMDKWDGGNQLKDNEGKDGGIISKGGTFSDGWLDDGKGTGSTVTEMGGLLRVEKGATVRGLHMGNFGQIEVMGVHYSAGESVTYADGKITLMSNNHSVWGATLDGSSYNPSSFQVWDDGGTAVIVYDQCFLRGTLISTPRGETEIQDLKAGDTVWALVDGKEIERKITATRSKRSKINRELPVDLAGWSVCIKAGAFGDNLPLRDLRVTSEHCFYFEGRFIPIRMLVNGFSIYYDTSLAHFEFFHIETEPHSIIRAEGVLTESWLNTEERREAVNLSNGITRLERIPSRRWEKDAAAPLDVSHAFAENLWNDFKQRALSLGIVAQKNYLPKFKKDPDLCLRLEDGMLLKAKNRRGNQYFFQIPAGKRAITLVSKKFRPSESVGPWMDDRRQLGVLVGKMTVAIGQHFHAIETHYHAANMQGWDVVESSPCRWTKGEAALPDLGRDKELIFGASLIVEILAGGPYPEQEKPKAYPYKMEKEA
ncbi:hypothetical protein FAI41_07325 [Acetobacteraceae bacterium]|nr:hypothetical protein FAI41_07325 [Acetobacteraceae bacterium]